jgi:hypothetical protein
MLVILVTQEAKIGRIQGQPGQNVSDIPLQKTRWVQWQEPIIPTAQRKDHSARLAQAKSLRPYPKTNK